jgi:hypothetical protein
MTMTAVAIAYRWNGLYAALTMPKKSDTTPQERADLEQRVEAGEWLRINDAAKVLGISRTKTDTLLRRGVIGHRLEPGSTYRQLNPADITRLLVEARRERRGQDDAPSGESDSPL